MGDFDEDCLSKASSAVAHLVEQHRKQAAGGSLFFGFFLLAKQKKETRQSRESDNDCRL